jgi:type IV pilus assembly protein PilY1
MYVAFFGGGWDKTETDITGRYLYGVNIENGATVYKSLIGTAVPGGVSALDADTDGWVDRLYFGDLAGGIWRLDLTAEATTDVATGNWINDPGGDPALERLYSLGADVMFFNAPVVVPALFDGGDYTWGLAIGSGDRANIADDDVALNHFYFALDVADDPSETLPLDATDLVGVAKSANMATGSYLDPASGDYGWRLILDNDEKVNADALVAGQQVLFATFVPTFEVPAAGGGSADPVCRAFGQGLLYCVDYRNANPSCYADPDDPGGPGSGGSRYTDPDLGLLVGGTAYTIGDETKAVFTSMEGKQEEETVSLFRDHLVTNWRQE